MTILCESCISSYKETPLTLLKPLSNIVNKCGCEICNNKKAYKFILSEKNK